MTSSALIGQTLAGRFRVTGFIGEGAMAAVYRAVQEEEPRDVALKVMHPHLTTDPTFVSRFRREARAAAQIQHPNTVRIISFGVDGNVLYIAMELLGGQDLFEILVMERRLSEARAARILVQVCDALVAAHEQLIVHRDLKPENIMILKDPSAPSGERVKVLDFGIAKILERDQAPSSEDDPASSFAHSALTTVGMVVGTPAYMSPEQCRGEPIDARSDVYSCGILLYQLITGRLPFTGDNAMDLAVKHVRSPPPPPSTVTPAIHPGMEQVILTALNKWPAQRQQNAAELQGALSRILPELAQRPHDLSTGPGSAPVLSMGPELSQRSIQQSLDADVVSTLRSSPISENTRSFAERDLDGDPALAPTVQAPVSEGRLGPAAGSNPYRPMAKGLGATIRITDNPASNPPTLPSSSSAGPFGSPSPWATNAPATRPPPSQLWSSRAPGSNDRRVWLLIPLAVIVGVAAGVVAFWLLR
jgi:eukaryotic-like serine/threonine-protein kinase